MSGSRSTGLDQEELLQIKRRRQLLDRALDALPTELRPVFVLVELEGATRSEAAELLAIPTGPLRHA